MTTLANQGCGATGADAADGGAGAADGVRVLSGMLAACGAADELKLQAFAAAHLQTTATLGDDNRERSGRLWLLHCCCWAADDADG